MAVLDLIFVRQPPAFSLAGPRLHLRAPRLSDWEAWRDIRKRSRSFLQPWEPSWAADSLTRLAFRRRLARYAEDWQRDEGYSFLLFRNTDGALLGGMALSNVRHGVAEMGSLGYWIGAPYARQGYSREALQLALSFAFEKLGLHRVEAACLPWNVPSRTLLCGAAFREEGLARQYLCIDGSWQDHVLYGLLRDEWQAKKLPSDDASKTGLMLLKEMDPAAS